VRVSVCHCLPCQQRSGSAFAAQAPDPPPSGPRIFISVDMEGIAGVVTDEQLGKEGFEYAKFRELMTEEANAAIAAARAAGAGEIVVADSHGSMQNLLVDRLPADVQLVRGSPRPLGMMQGLDDTFDAVRRPVMELFVVLLVSVCSRYYRGAGARRLPV
jgi:hypothetical protein